MADKIKLEIVTPEKEIFSDMVESINIPTLCGSIGILYNHAPILTVVDIGVLKYVKDNQQFTIAVDTGFLEFKDNKAKILVTSAECAKDIDKERAVSALKRAQNRLQEKRDNLDHARAEAAMKRAMARIKASD
jgi:F-type H+-transporting ATPase subunit epsilon